MVGFGVTVVDRKGNLLTDLVEGDFEVYEDGQRQTLRFFLPCDAQGARGGGVPLPPADLHLGALFDISGSMDADMHLARTAAIRFLDALQDASDFTLVEFDTEVRVARYSQSEFGRLVERIRSRKATEKMTALWDATGVYLDGAAAQDGRKILVLYTDGGDNGSSITFGDLINLLKASDVTVHVIGFLENQSTSARLEQQARLRRIAEVAGGQAFFPASVRDLDGVFARIATEIDAQYSMGYVSTSAKTDGAWRKVEIRVVRPDLKGVKVRARQGYFAPLKPYRDRGRAVDRFELVSDFELRGDQRRAIAELVEGLNRGDPHQVLLGVTGSGKTFTMAQVIAQVNRPALVMVHNKTLAAQLYQEFRRFFPSNAVEYFVSYYDYYQPEAYVPASDTYIEKEATINDEIDRMRLSATRSLFERRDVIIVASVSCIYGLGSPESYYAMLLPLERGQRIEREQILRRLVEIQYERNDVEFERGTFRVRGDIIEVYPSYEEQAIRIGLFGDEVDELLTFDPLTGRTTGRRERVTVFPRSHFVMPRERTRRAIESIKAELVERRSALEFEGKLLEAQRVHQRTMFDLEMMREIGYCHGIENYARHLTGRAAGEPPPTLLDYLPEDAVVFVDESHQTVPQIRGMYHGDRSRKTVLVEYGFRLPSALDNRPLNFDEWQARAHQLVFVSATPGPFELQAAGGVVVEQIIRPTGLTDPPVEIRPVRGQVDDLLGEIRLRADRGERVLVTTLTKRMAEDLTQYYQELGVRVRYLHSDIDTLERVEILRDLRRGEFDVLVGINLLREGLDLPEVSLVAILDADKEGFLRSAGSLIQTSGRAARNVNGRVFMYADVVTESMRAAIAETDRRRRAQEAYNVEHGITPTSIVKNIEQVLSSVYERDYMAVPAPEPAPGFRTQAELDAHVAALERQMREAAGDLDFERAAALRDRARALKRRELGIGPAAGA